LYLPGGNSTSLDAIELAEIFQEVFTANTKIESRAMKSRDNLYVLKYTDMPAIILEMGYLSNDYDRSYLVDTDYHDDLAKGVYASIMEVFKQYPMSR
jgi:N-acetylmuramoyl-L-alanine amidase